MIDLYDWWISLSTLETSIVLASSIAIFISIVALSSN